MAHLIGRSARVEITRQVAEAHLAAEKAAAEAAKQVAVKHTTMGLPAAGSSYCTASSPTRSRSSWPRSDGIRHKSTGAFQESRHFIAQVGAVTLRSAASEKLNLLGMRLKR